MSYNPEFHHRRSIRLKGYDYSQEGAYFITLCVRDRGNLFGKIVNGKMVLSEAGKIAYDEWFKTPELRKNIELDAFIVMPNHLHGIIIIKEAYRKGELHSPIDDLQDIDMGEDTDTSKGEARDTDTSKGEDIRKGELHSPIDDLQDIDMGVSGDKEKGVSGDKEKGVSGDKEKGVSGDKEKGFSGDKEKGFSGDKEKGFSGDKEKGEFNSPQRPQPLQRLQRVSPKDSIWQRDYYEHIIRDQQAYENIANYIINNPAKWKGDKFFEE
jgi:putative transposase